MKNTIAIIIMYACCISCSVKDKNKQNEELYSGERVKVDLKKEYKDSKFPNTNYSMFVQRLEDSEDYPIGHIDKLIVDDKKIYILDRYKAKSVFIYNRNGKLLHVINHIGRGPGEFGVPQDFDVDKKTGNVIVLDTNLRKVVFYSPKGEYIKEFKCDFFSNRIVFDNDNNIIVDTGNIPSEDSNYYLRKVDQNGKLLSTFFPSNPSTVGITFNPRNPFQQCGKNLFYLPTLSNNIYVLEGDSSRIAYHIDFGDDWPSDDFCKSVNKLHPLEIRNMVLEKNYAAFLNCIQTKDVLHIDFYKQKQYSFYYHKKTKKSLLISMEDKLFSLPLAAYNDEFVFAKYNELTGAPTIVFYTVNFDLQ